MTSIREVVGAEGPRVVSNEIYRRAQDGRMLPAAPPSPPTADLLTEHGFDLARLLEPAGSGCDEHRGLAHRRGRRRARRYWGMGGPGSRPLPPRGAGAAGAAAGRPGPGSACGRGSRGGGAGVGVTSWPVAAVLAAAGTWWLPRLLGPDRAHAERLARIEAVAAWTEQVRDLMAAASGLQGAIASTAPIAPAPIRGQVAALAERIRTDPQEALERFAAEADVPTADLVAVALGSAAERHAADLGRLLSGLAEAARDQAAMLVRTAAGRARVRTATRIITATTLALAALLMLFNPTYLAPFDSVAGQGCSR
ncbi:type II secretion system F family protein [Nocardiopsis composta]